jgi:hypothetical protein
MSDGTFNVGMVGADPRKTQVSFHKNGFRDVARELGEEAPARGGSDIDSELSTKLSGQSEWSPSNSNPYRTLQLTRAFLAALGRRLLNSSR